jgi:hypothetical protein
MEYNFSKHTQVGKRFENRITVTGTRHIGLPTQFYKDNNLDGFVYAVLFYDKKNNVVGIKFTNTKEEGAIAIAKNNQGYGGYISGTSFFKANRINAKKYANRYDYTKTPLRDVGIEEDGELFMFELKEKERKEVAV